MANLKDDKTVFQKARALVAHNGGWSCVFNHYPQLQDAMKSTRPQVPCPFNGSGKTVFRFLPSWVTDGAAQHNGFGRMSGIDVVQNLEGFSTAGKAARFIFDLLGGRVNASVYQNYQPTPSVKAELSEIEVAKRLKKLHELSQRSLWCGDAYLYDQYLGSRGLPVAYFKDVRFARNVEHWSEDKICTEDKNAILLTVRDKTGKQISLHRHYLDGFVKTKTVPAKKMMPPITTYGGESGWKGASVRLLEPVILPKNGKTLAVAEGFETAVSVIVGTSLPCWVGISAPNMARLEIPSDIETLFIFRDVEPSGAGALAAIILAEKCARAGIKVFIVTPPLADGEDDKDWLDVWNDDSVSFAQKARANTIKFQLPLPQPLNLKERKWDTTEITFTKQVA